MPCIASNRGCVGLFMCKQSNTPESIKKPTEGTRGGDLLNDDVRKEIIREQLKSRHHGKSSIRSKYRPKYPESAEREYIRLINEYMAIEKDVLMKYIPELKRIINEGTPKYNTDAKNENDRKRRLARFSEIDNTIRRLQMLFESIQKELDSAFGMYDLKRNIERIAASDHKLSIREWKKAVSKTLGIDILEDYYSGDYYKEMIEKWISSNVDLIKTQPKESLGKMKELVYKDYMSGISTTNIVKELQAQYGMDKRHARLIARDQTAKLNSEITQSQQRDAGVSKYEWSGTLDRRERSSHRALEGKVFSWDNPPETDGGRRCHPGEDYQCRCCALPVFDIDNLDLPM